ncbi:hypothetical protein [Actinoplanes sp. TFC3]|uniref:hypothetical protein n=1 Tax=Actinoplanes sp. TFC3 TaxID=1710355 RepID=UPI00082E8E42|nr:hypothetical protein [Actinoplanes sp. TFC3]
MQRRRRWAWGLGIATASALTAFGVASWQANAAPNPAPSTAAAADAPRVSDPQPGPEAAAGTGADPLTTDEVGKARAAALTPELARKSTDVTGAAGPEYLSIELAEEGDARTADVYFYDYKTDKLVKQVVDLRTGKVAGSYSAAGMQLPASDREVQTALDLLMADPLAAELKSAYQQATGKTLAGKDGLTVTAHVFKARPADAATKQCGKHRCLQLVVQSKDGTFIDANDLVIDLSGRTVARLK